MTQIRIRAVKIVVLTVAWRRFGGCAGGVQQRYRNERCHESNNVVLRCRPLAIDEARPTARR